MITEGIKFNLKIFQIDKSYYEFNGKDSAEIIEIIRTNHQKKLYHKFEKSKLMKPSMTHFKDENFEFWSYCFNQIKEKFYWKLFLPDELTQNQNFEIIEFSFVLFIKYKKEIYCVISGSGMSVIKKFIHPSFGIEIYQRIANSKEDIIVELETRGIANNISQKKQIFNYNQTIAETLEYSEVPSKIKLKIRKELKNGIFKKYKLSSGLVLLEVGSYFSLRKKLDFEQLKELIKDLHEIREKNTPTQLTLFHKINVPELVKELNETLKETIIEDIILHNRPNAQSHQSDIIEIVHPSKLERFYECDSFLIKSKYSKGKNDIEVDDKSKLYFECTKHIFNNAKNITDKVELKKMLYTLSINGFVNQTPVTYGTFFSHITAEIEYAHKKYFKIDGHWYLLEDEFLRLINNDAKEFYTKYRLNEKILLKWPKGEDEDYYNKSHSHLSNHFVLDKVLYDNIELCDLLVLNENSVYFIHVKNDFSTKMRDLYIQVILSAKRLSNDLKNNQKSSYLENTLKKYNEYNPQKTINYTELIEKLRKNPAQINFVMAYKNNSYNDKSALEKIEFSKSNIAKYSLVQVIKEMQPFKFGIKLFDISEIE